MPLKEVGTVRFWVAVFTEMQATFLFVLISTGSAMSLNQNGDFLHIALTFGLAIATLVHATGHISGGHLNPAVSIAMVVTGHIHVIRGIFYVCAQCGGAIAASALLKALTPDNIQGTLAADQLQGDVTVAAGFFVEFFVTWQFVMTVYATVDKNRQDAIGSPALAIGLSIAIGHLFAIGYTNCGMNPARSLGPAVISGVWENHWIYWVAPISAAILAGLQYEFVLAPSSCITKFKAYVRCQEYEPPTKYNGRTEDDRL